LSKVLPQIGAVADQAARLRVLSKGAHDRHPVAAPGSRLALHQGTRACPGTAPRLPWPSGEPFKIPRRRSRADHTQAVAVNFAISSGSLIPLTAAEAVGRFDEDFFIDAIDIEWCSRAWKAGFSVWVGMDIPMTHQLGMGVINLPFGLRMANQPPERLYTYFRNQVAMLRLPHIPAAWKLRFVASLPARSFIYVISNRFARPVAKAIGFGIADGLMNRLGAPGRWRAPVRMRRRGAAQAG
jgi:rhamnosyltransferase